MSATAGGSEPLGSASSIIPDTEWGYHILKIDGYSLTKGTPNGDYLTSYPFTVGGHRWCIRYHPNGDRSDTEDYISIYLLLYASASEAVKARYQIRFIDDVDDNSLELEEFGSFSIGSGWGHTKFVKRDYFENSKHLKDDSFTLRCDIVVLNEFRAEEMAEVATPEFVSVPPSNLHQHLGDLLRSEKGVDVVFEVGNEKFAAHRYVLAARSPVFSAELFGMMKESDTTGVVRIDDMEAKVFKALLHFVYTDSLPKTIIEEEEEEEEEHIMCEHLLVAADRYNLERLKLMCEKKLCKYIDVGTVATVLALAEQHNCSGLKKACFSFLKSRKNLKAVVSSDSFKHLSRSCPSVLEELVTMLGT